MRLKKLTVFIILPALITLAVVYGLISKPVRVETAKAVRGYMSVTINEEGRTRVRDRYVISAPVAGYASRIELNAGDVINKGQTIVRIEPSRSVVLDVRSRAEAQARISAAEASLQAAVENARAVKADSDFAESELQRISALYEDKLLSKADMDNAETRARRAKALLRSAEFAVEVAKHEKEAAHTALKYSAATEAGKSAEVVLLKSPVNGNIFRVLNKSERTVQAGEPLLEIGNPAALEIEVDVLSADAVKIKPGARVVFERWGQDKPLKGMVRTVEPSGFTKISALGVEEQRVLVISDLTSPYEEWNQLGDSYRVEASFIVWEDENILQIPNSALFRHKDEWAVFVMEGNKAHLQEVQTGHRNGLMAEVASGLKEGETVITHPDRSIEDNSRVREGVRGRD